MPIEVPRKIPLESTITRWSRNARATGPADHDEFARAVYQLYHRVKPRVQPEIVWANSIDEFIGYAEMAGDSLTAECLANPIAGIMDIFTLELKPNEMSRVAMTDRTISGYAPAILEAVVLAARTSKLQAPMLAGQSFAAVMAVLEHGVPRLQQHRQWITDYFLAWSTITASCTAWYPTEKYVVVLERPTAVRVNASNQLHSTTGPAVEWNAGSLWRIDGVEVPRAFILDPTLLSTHTVLNEPNLERKRAYVTLYGQERLLRDANAIKVSKDDWGTLWRLPIPNDEDLLMVEVLNSTPEPDGHFKTYFMRVEPDCRVMLPGGRLGNAQNLTPLNAIASTFGFTGADYAQKLEFQS